MPTDILYTFPYSYELPNGDLVEVSLLYNGSIEFNIFTPIYS